MAKAMGLPRFGHKELSVAEREISGLTAYRELCGLAQPSKVFNRLGLGFHVVGGPRLPCRDSGQFARALVLVGLGHGPVMFRRLPVDGRGYRGHQQAGGQHGSDLCFFSLL